MAFRLSTKRTLSWLAAFSARRNGNSGNKVAARFKGSQTTLNEAKKCSKFAAFSFGVALFGLGGKKEDEVEDQNKILENIKLGIMAQRVQPSFRTSLIPFVGRNLIASFSFAPLKEGDLDKAESLLHVALQQAEILNSFDGVTFIYDALANVAFERVKNSSQVAFISLSEHFKGVFK